MLPLSLSNYEFSHQEGLSLKYSRTAPPLAIFDDEKISLLTEDATTIPSGTTTKKVVLSAGRHGYQVSGAKLALKLSKQFGALQKTASITAPPKKEIRYLAGMSLQKSSPGVAIIKSNLKAPTRAITALKMKASTLNKIAELAPQNVQSTIFAKDLRPRLRERVEEMDNFDEVLNEDYGTESFEARAKNVLAQNGVNPEAPSDYEIANTYGTGVGHRKTYAQRMHVVNQRKVDATILARNFAKSGYTKGKNTPKPETASNDTNDVNQKDTGFSEEKGTTVASRNESKPTEIKQAIISGPIEMTKGLALTNAQQLTVYRQIGGTRYGEGRVILNEGRYEIYVDNPNSGVVIAELTDNGNLIGRAEVLMPEVMRNAKTPDDLKNIPIKIEPILDQVVAENISAYSYFKKERLKNSEIKISDAVNADAKVFNSTIVLKSSKENYWGNIIVGSSKQLFRNILNPDATIDALKQILGVTTPKNEMGIIKGDVSIEGKQIADAQVEIIGENDMYKPVYFNSFIPDKSLEKTTANGQYAFVDIPQGSYLVRAKYKGKYLSPQLAPVEPGYITQVRFDVKKPTLAEAFVFDIQTSEMMNAEIGFLGSEQKIPIKSRKLISFSGSEGVQFLEVQAQDSNYYTTRVTVDKSEKEILIPMISQGWLGDLLTRLRVTTVPDTGLIIGTALALPYTVELDPRAYNEDTKIMYFDNRGQLVPGAMATPVGGGFVAVNVNQGIRSLFSKYQGTRNLKITTMAVDSAAINVFNSKF